MKILVCAKRVVDPNVKVRVKSDYTDVDIAHSKMSLNPFDENAIEEAVRLKESGKASEIVAVSVGEEKSIETLRVALARGCDRGIFIKHEKPLDSINIARILVKIVEKENPDLILLGKQSIDNDSNQVGQMLAGKLGYPQATFVSKLDPDDNASMLYVTREVDNGNEVVKLALPAVVTADLLLNEPRFVKLPELMKAKKKPIEELELNSLSITIKPSMRLIKVSDGELKKECVMLDSVSGLLQVLKQYSLS